MTSSTLFTTGDTVDAPRSDLPHLLTALAADLRSVRYTLDGVADLLGPAASAALERDQLIPALLVTEARERGHVDRGDAGRRDTGQGDTEQGDTAPHGNLDGVPATQAGAQRAALAAVVRLWLLAVPQPGEKLDAVLPATGAKGLLELRLIEPDPNGGYRAAADLRPYGWSGESADVEMWVASDLAAHQRPGVLRHDHVLGIGQASTTLVQTTIRRTVERALDLGTGCGIQSFHLLSHASHVTATDISERALAFTRFNLLLNANVLSLDPERLEERVSLRLGSLLEPVEGEFFDVVVSNPPFVITPRTSGEKASDQFTYRDGGLPGDEIVATLIAGLPGVLAPGGTAQLLGNWEVAEGWEWHERPDSWVPEGTDAWFIQREQVGPEQYAETWLQDSSESRDREQYKESYAAYLRDFASRNVTGIGFGMVFLRRPVHGVQPAHALLRRFEEITYPIEQPVGPHLGAAVERFDWLAVHNLEQAHLLVADDVTEERHQRPGAEHPGVILLRQGAGLRRTNLLSTALAGFVSACDGELSVAQIIGALEALLGGGDGFDPGTFREGLLHEVRNLVADGFLLPVPAVD